MKLSFAEKVSNKCAQVFASWKFGIASLLLLNAWAILNKFGVLHFDPDLAFANFNLSQLTYFVDLVLMMNAVRLAITDRQKLDAIFGLEKKIDRRLDIQDFQLKSIEKKIDLMTSAF